MLSIVAFGFFQSPDSWQPTLWILAAASMIYGNLVALRQTNIVRMLAYSSIAQGGFILVPLAVSGDNQAAVASFEAVVIYILIYGAMNLGAFAVVIAVARRTRSGRDRVVLRARTDRTRARGRDEHVPAVARRHPAARRVVRQVRDVPRRLLRQHAECDRARRDRRRRVGHRVLLLRGGGTADVVPRADSGVREHTAHRAIPAALIVAIGLTAAVVVVIGIYPQFFARVGELAFT